MRPLGSGPLGICHWALVIGIVIGPLAFGSCHCATGKSKNDEFSYDVGIGTGPFEGTIVRRSIRPMARQAPLEGWARWAGCVAGWLALLAVVAGSFGGMDRLGWLCGWLASLAGCGHWLLRRPGQAGLAIWP